MDNVTAENSDIIQLDDDAGLPEDNNIKVSTERNMAISFSSHFEENSEMTHPDDDGDLTERDNE